MFFKKKSKEPKEPKTITLVKYRPIFTTVDGKAHIGFRCKWADNNRMDVKECHRKDIISQGYILDNDGVMYPLTNVLSIDFELTDCKKVIDSFYHEWQWFFGNEEVEKMTEYKE